MIVWLVGLSGAGKTTIGRALVERWRTIEPATVLIDGDEIRSLFDHNSSGSDYSIGGRRINAERIVNLSSWLDNQSINAVVNILCIFPDVLVENRLRFSGYLEVFVDVPMKQLEVRDPKGLYKGANSGFVKNVVGKDIPFPRPKQPHIVIDNSGKQATNLHVNLILEHIGAV